MAITPLVQQSAKNYSMSMKYVDLLINWFVNAEMVIFVDIVYIKQKADKR